MRYVRNPITGIEEPWSDESWEAERDRRLIEWQDAKSAIELAKSAEMRLRKSAVDFGFDVDVKAGTERVQLGNGWEAKAVKSTNYSWAKDEDGATDLDALEAALCEIEEDGPEAVDLVERLVKWSPRLSVSVYEGLSRKHRAIIDRVVITTDGAPSLEIIAPPRG